MILEATSREMHVRIQWSKWRWYWGSLVISEICERRLTKHGPTKMLTAGRDRSHCNIGLGLRYHQWCWSIVGSALQGCSLLLLLHALHTAAAQGRRCVGRA